MGDVIMWELVTPDGLSNQRRKFVDLLVDLAVARSTS
jgi:hypothetical protein